MAIIKDGKKVTPKQWALQTALRDVDTMTDYYYEREPDEWRQMTEKEQLQIFKQYEKIHQRVTKLLNRSLGKISK